MERFSFSEKIAFYFSILSLRYNLFLFCRELHRFFFVDLYTALQKKTTVVTSSALYRFPNFQLVSFQWLTFLLHHSVKCFHLKKVAVMYNIVFYKCNCRTISFIL